MKALVILACFSTAIAFADEPATPPTEVPDVDSEEPAPPLPPAPTVLPPTTTPVVATTRPKFIGQVGVGASYAYLMGESFGAGVFDLQLGGEGKHVAITFRQTLHLGRSRLGLQFERVQWGPTVMGKLTDRVRLGVSLHLGAFFYQVPFGRGDSEGSLQAGAALSLTVDLIQDRGGRALILWSDLGYDWMQLADSSQFGLAQHTATWNVGVGYRF